MADSSDLITVTCLDHHDKLVGGLWNFFRSSRAVDFDLRWGGRSIRAHRLILDVFLSPEKLDQWSRREFNVDDVSNSPTVDAGLEAYLPGTNHLDCLLEFLYRGCITVDKGSLERLLELAKELDLRMLVDAIETARNDAVSLSNQKRRRRKGIPVKLENSDVPAEGSENGDTEEPPIKTKRRRSVKPASNTVPGEVKRGRGRPKGSRNSATGSGVNRTPVRRKRKTSMESNSESDASGVDELEKFKEEVDEERKDSSEPAKRKRKSNGGSDKPVREKGGTPRSKAGYKRLWLQRQPLLSCEHCPYETHSKQSFRVHESRHDKTAVVYRCDVCSVAFLTEDSLERHKSTNHQTALAVYTCQLCEYTTNKERNLKTHRATVHRLTTKGEPLAKTFDCTMCNFSSAYASHLSNHLLTHQADRPFKCEHCSYATVRKYDLDKHHKVVHLKQRLFLCVECGHKSSSAVHLKIHMRSHTGERPFVCLECGKAYSNKERLKLHVRRHQSDEKPFICDLCGFSAFRRDSLQLHMKRIHKTTLTK